MKKRIEQYVSTSQFICFLVFVTFISYIVFILSFIYDLRPLQEKDL